jgi:hypothetical protein
MLAQFTRTKSQRESHEATCIKRVQDTYNESITGYNSTRRANAIALGSLWTGSFEDVIVHPGKPKQSKDPIAYALCLANYHHQYWTSALGFLQYIRDALNLHTHNKLLSSVAQTIEDRYFEPLQKQALNQWLTLLVIGGTADDLQLAREKLASPYISGVYDTSSFLNSPLRGYAQNPLSDQMRNSFQRALTHARSNPDSPADSLTDLGL